VPIKNEKHEVVLFLASHKDVSKSDPDNPSDDEELDDGAESPGPTDASNPYHRRRSRAVLYQLSGHYRRSETVKSKLKLNNVSHFTSVTCESYRMEFLNLTSAISG
jgi:potassium voltage-gated channel Eag-related subfamily H protein 8